MGSLAAGEDVIGFRFRFGFGLDRGFGDEVVFDFGGDLFGGLEVVEVFVGEGFAEATEAALAALVGGDGFEEMEAVEVGPETVGDEDLGVGDLPKEGVGYALFAGGADYVVGVGHVPRVKSAGNAEFVEGFKRA